MAQDIVTTGSREVESTLDKDKDGFVTFEVGNQLFGIPVLKVQDILNGNSQDTQTEGAQLGALSGNR